jgi:hypothetical protein
VASQTASATVFSETGTLPGASGYYVTLTLTLLHPGVVDIQTYGFGGGTNAASTVISPGGFDPFVGVFSGTGPSATFIDGTSDILSNYTSEPNACGRANEVYINSTYGDQCGDVFMEFNTGAGFDPTLAAGVYTIILSDALYYPAAATGSTNNDLGDGFTDFTGGVNTFSTCYDPNTCIADDGNWAIDIAAPEQSTISISSVPEPASFILAGAGLLTLGFALRRSNSNRKP